MNQDRLLCMHLKGQVLAGVERKVFWALCAVSRVSTNRVGNSTSCPHLGVGRKHGQYQIPVITMGDFLECASFCSLGAGLYRYIR